MVPERFHHISVHVELIGAGHDNKTALQYMDSNCNFKDGIQKSIKDAEGILRHEHIVTSIHIKTDG